MKLEITPSLAPRLEREAARRGVSTEEHALSVLREGADSAELPSTGADLVAYWRREGVIGSRPEVEDACDHARTVRQSAERRARTRDAAGRQDGSLP